MAVENEVDAAGRARRAHPMNNATYLAAASMGAKIFSLFFALYANHTLHPALMGGYKTGTALVGVFVVVTDLGLGTLAVRDVAEDRSRAAPYISNLLVMRTLLAVLSIALIGALAPLYFAPPLRPSVYIYALSLIPLAIFSTLQLVFQFSERLAYGAALNIVNAAATAALSILVLFRGYHVLALMVVYTAVMSATAAAAAWLVYTRFLPRRLEVSLAWWPTLVKAALPFAALTFINILYNYADRLILYPLSGCHGTTNNGCAPVGQYSAAYQPLDILVTIFVVSINAAVLPAFMRIGTASRQRLAGLVRTAGTLALVCGVPVALFATFYATDALRIVGGKDYLVAAPALRIVIWTFPCVLLLTLLYNALYAVHRQRVVTAAFVVTLAFNVGLNLALIPRYSYLASAAITVASEVVNGVIVIYALRRSIGPLGLMPAAVRVAGIAAVTAVALWALRPYGIVGGLPVGVVVVALGVRLTGVLGPAEVDILARLPIVGRYARLLS